MLDNDSNSFSSEITMNEVNKVNRSLTKKIDDDEKMFLSCQPPRNPDNEAKPVNMLREATKHEKAYKLIVDYLNDIMISHRKEIILPKDLLVEIIKILTNAVEVIVRFNYDISCCGKAADVLCVNNIIIILNEHERTGLDFGLGFPQVASFLHQCNVNFNFVRNMPPKKKIN